MHYLAVGVVLALISACASAQTNRSPADTARGFIDAMRMMAEDCLLNSQIAFDTLLLKQFSAAEAVKKDRACPRDSMQQLPQLRAKTVGPVQSEIKTECAKAIDDLYVDVMVHWENYLSNPVEPLPDQRRRVHAEVDALRAKASRIKYLC